MPRRLTPEQKLQNAAFLRHLNRTGNVRLAAREVGVPHTTFHHRRARHPGFAQRWAAATAIADGRFHRAGGLKLAESADVSKADTPAERAAAHRTRGGEGVITVTRTGKLQMRRAQPGKLTQGAEQAFLQALSATANVALSAAAAGASQRAFYRRRNRSPAFAREWRLALEQGYEEVENALLESWSLASEDDAAWRSNDAPAVPQMTANQALQLLHLHQKGVLLRSMNHHMRVRPHESSEAHSARLRTRYVAKLAEEAEHKLLAQVVKNMAWRDPRLQPPPPSLPALDQVTGWSKADPAKTPHDESTALFGGFRVEHLTEEQKRLFELRRGRGRRKR